MKPSLILLRSQVPCGDQLSLDLVPLLPAILSFMKEVRV